MWTFSKYFFLLFILLNFFTVQSLPVKDLQTRGVTHVVDIISNFFRGKGTYFHPVTEGGAIGSCGPIANDRSRICAMVHIRNIYIIYIAKF